jgi:hypothetical protein
MKPPLMKRRLHANEFAAHWRRVSLNLNYPGKDIDMALANLLKIPWHPIDLAMWVIEMVLLVIDLMTRIFH